MWKVKRSAGGVITNLEKKTEFVNHYSFHIMDPDWGHLMVKMSGHPPFGAQVILNGHEYVACQAQAAGIGFIKEGNCFTGITDPRGLAQIAETLLQDAAIGRLGQACDRWIYTACLCFGLDLADQQASGFRYYYSVYQAVSQHAAVGRLGQASTGGYIPPAGASAWTWPGRSVAGSAMGTRFTRRNTAGTCCFAPAGRGRTCPAGCWTGPGSRLDIPMLRTIFGLKNRPHRNRAAGPPAQEVVIEKPQYGLAWFRIRFGMLQLKACTKGEHVLRFEVTCRNAKELRRRRALDDFGEIITRLAGMADRFATTLDCAGVSFLPDGLLDELPVPSQIGAVRTGGIDLNTPRIRAALAAAVALAPAPPGFTAAEFAARVCQMTRHDGYTIRQAAYDLRKLRGKNLIDKPGRTRRYQVPPSAVRTIAALLALRDHVIEPILAGVRSPRPGPKPARWTRIDAGYQTLRTGMQALFDDLGISMLPAAA